VDCSRLIALFERHCREEWQSTPIVGLTLHRADAPLANIRTLYRPTVCVIAQGRKRVLVGEQAYEYDAARYLVVGIDVPVLAHVVEASKNKPYFCAALRLDPRSLAQLIAEVPAVGSADEVREAVGLAPCDAGLLDATTRLVALLDAPADAPVLAPMVEREILYRLLQGRQRPMLRHAVTAGSRLAQIGRAAERIRTHHAEPRDVERPAGEVGMSLTSFHRHFKSIMGTSPLQYRAQVRLHEARRLLLADGRSAGDAGFRVGYESQSQFSREYRRMFGLPPAADAERLCASLQRA
jgi:AraC-like DNA-binding protein